MAEPNFALFVFYANGSIFDLSYCGDIWDVRTAETYVSQPDSAHQLGVRTCDAYIRLKKRRNGSSQSIKALVMSYYIIQEVEFTPEVEVKLTIATAGSFLYGLRLLYLTDQNALNYYVPRAFLVPGDGYDHQVDQWKVRSMANKYFITSNVSREIYALYSVEQWKVVKSQFTLQANVSKEITPPDISPAYRYMHVFYFENKLSAPGSGNLARTTPAIDYSTHLCVVCMSNEADHLFSPCNHVVTCASCRSSFNGTQCPMCRQPFSQVHKVFFS